MGRKKLKFRSERISTNEGNKGSAVSYARAFRTDSSGKEKASAQLLDVSSTGARLLSRGPIRAKVGDIVNVDFALEGSDYRIKSPARIVRQQNEFVFAVRFIGMRGFKREVLDSAMGDLTQFKKDFKRRATFLAARKSLAGFFSNRKVRIALAAGTLFALGLSVASLLN